MELINEQTTSLSVEAGEANSSTAAAVDAAAPPAKPPAERNLSALRDNIETKGKNAYYYAHSNTANGPKWDGKPEPKLLGRTSSSVGDADAEATTNSTTKPTPAFDIHKSNITSYAFLDEGKKVRLYVELDGIGDACDGVVSGADGEETEKVEETADIPKAEVKLDCGERSMCLSIENYPTSEQSRCLSFGRLYGTIERGTFKVKKEKIVVTLWKKAKVEEEEAVNDNDEEGETAENEIDDGEEKTEKKPSYEEWPSIAAKGVPDHEFV